MQNLIFDLRYAVRILAKSPIFSTVAILSLAFGIGANTAIFTLLDQVLLRLLPVKDPAQLVLLSSVGSHYGSNTGANAFSYPMCKDFRDRNQVFSGTLAVISCPATNSTGQRCQLSMRNSHAAISQTRTRSGDESDLEATPAPKPTLKSLVSSGTPST